MADAYSMVKGGKLKLKGGKHKSKKHKKHKRKHEEDDEPKVDEDSAQHGGWWTVSKFSEIKGAVCMELGSLTYVRSLDNGLLELGPPQNEGDGPDPTEIFTAIKCSETKVAIKSGYDKFLSIDTDGQIVGRSDAIGPREQFEPVFQEGKMALLGCNNCFMSADMEDQSIVCHSKTAGDREMMKFRRSDIKETTKKDDGAIDISGKIGDVEVNFVKRFQSFQDRRLRVNEESRQDLKRARRDGTLHEALLDRREKMKADRYCK